MKTLTLFLFLSLLNGLYVFAQTSENILTLQKFFDAYNEHRPEKLMEFVADDFKMYSVMEDTVTADIVGKNALQQWLTAYFKNMPDVISKADNITESGNYVTFTETAYWGENRSQSSLAVYEVVNGKFRRVWYYY